MWRTKCALCNFGSWLVGVASICLGVAGIFDLDLPAGTLAGVTYTVLIVVALGFLYYQIVPCPRCARKQHHQIS